MTDLKTTHQDERFYDLIYRDDLTGLYNRRFYKEQIEKDNQRLKDKKDEYSFLMFDIDHFKSINDNYSHEEGDHILKKVSSIIKEQIAENGVIIRFAGDEFIILMPGIPKERAREIALNLKNSVAESQIPLSRTDGTLKVTLSIGVSNYPIDTQNLLELLHIADEAAYISKKKGRNAVSTIDEKKAEVIEPRFLHRYFPCKKFIGHDDLTKELKRLTLPGVGIRKPLTIIEGPLGIGKTRILSEIMLSLDPQRFTVLRNHCDPSTIAQPFWPITGTLQRLLEESEELTSTITNQLGQDKIKELLPLIPNFSRYLLQDYKTRDLTPQQRRDLLLEALEEILTLLNEQKPLVIGIDDFQWSNLGTQMLLERLKINPKARDIAVFLTINEEEVVSRKDTELLNYLERLEEKEILNRHLLNPLCDAEMEEMIISILPELSKYADLKETIKKKSRGIPLSIEDILKLLIYKGIIHTQEGKLNVEPFDTAIIPDNMIETVNPGIQELDEEVRELLCKASVIGGRFSIDLLKKFDGRDDLYVQDIINRAEKAAVISGDPEDDTFTFSSNATRDILYNSLDDREKKAHHNRLAEIEKELNKEEIETALARIAYHFAQSGDIEKSQQLISRLIKDYESFLSPRSIDLYIGKAPEKKEWLEETALSPENEAQALRVIKLIQVTLSNIRQFPIDSEIVKGSFESSFWELKKLFENIDVVTYSDGDDEILINGKAPISQIKDRSSEEKFLEILKNAGLKGITLSKEISREHFFEFLKMIMLDPQEEIKKLGGWTKVLNDRGIESIITNERIYVAVAERDLFDPKKLKEETITVRKADSEDNKAPVDIEAREEKLELVKTLEEELLYIKNKILTDSEWGEDVGKIKEMLDKIFEKHNILEHFIEKIRSHIKESSLTRKKEETPDSSQESQEGNEQERKISGELLNVYRTIDIMTITKQRFSPEVIIRDFESKDDDQASSSAAALASKGQEAIPALLNYIKSTESMLGRKRAIHILKKIAANVNNLLIEELMGNTSGEEKKRIIEVLHDFADIDITNCVKYFLRHPEHDTRQAIISLISRRSTVRTDNLLLEVLNDKKTEENKEIVKDAIQALGNMKVKAAVSTLIDMIKKRTIFVNEQYQELQEAACLALGKIGDRASVPFLMKALITTPPIFLMRNKPSKVRAAAAYALSHFPSDDVRKALQRALKDPSDDVRSAANLALYNLDKKIPNKGETILGAIKEE